MLTTCVGRPVAELDTPVLLVDLDAMDRNIAFVAGEARAAGVGWRPHAKGHKCPAIAHRQLAAGAIGVTCAKLGEAEVMAAGVRSILVANQIVGPIKARRLAALVASSGVEVIAAVDDAGNVAELAAAARAAGARLPLVVEVDTGMGRCGVAPGGPAVELARWIAGSEGVEFAGLMAWEGHALAVADAVERRGVIEAAVGRLAAAAMACRDAGLEPAIVSCGGSGTFLTAARLPGVTEIQAGGATLGDGFYRELGVPVEPALTLLTTVISRPTPERIVVDAGRKAIDPSQRKPVPLGLEGVVEVGFSAEHGTLRLAGPSAGPAVGERLGWAVGYHDQAVHLHEALYAVREGTVVAVWPVAGRGRLQ
jgi:D-serine deaminase-like pyridoxal phosphate-dependent protein